MNAWGDEDPPRPTGAPLPQRRRVRGRHVVVAGLVIAAVGAVVSALSPTAVGPLVLVLGLSLATFGAFGWVLEALGAWNDDPSGGEIRLTDVARLPTRLRRH